MPLPSRPATYILTLLLVTLGVLVWWLSITASNPALMKAIEAKKQNAVAKPAQ